LTCFCVFLVFYSFFGGLFVIIDLFEWFFACFFGIIFATFFVLEGFCERKTIDKQK